MKIAKTDFRIKFSEFFPKASGRIRTRPDASERIRALPSRSQQVRASPKPSKNLRDLAKNLRKLREKFWKKICEAAFFTALVTCWIQKSVSPKQVVEFTCWMHHIYHHPSPESALGAGQSGSRRPSQDGSFFFFFSLFLFFSFFFFSIFSLFSLFQTAIQVLAT